MSIIVRDMEMPENCGSCPLSKSVSSSIGNSIVCSQIGRVGARFDDEYEVLNNRHPRCPLFEVKAWKDI